jgi:hypothetical protein
MTTIAPIVYKVQLELRCVRQHDLVSVPPVRIVILQTYNIMIFFIVAECWCRESSGVFGLFRWRAATLHAVRDFENLGSIPGRPLPEGVLRTALRRSGRSCGRSISTANRKSPQPISRFGILLFSSCPSHLIGDKVHRQPSERAAVILGIDKLSALPCLDTPRRCF